MARLTRVLLLAALALAARPVAAADAAGLDRIFEGKAAGEPASFLVLLRDQADLSGAQAIADRNERRRFVFEALRATADATQEGLRRRLASTGVAFRPFYLVNMIEVEGDRALADELASRREVALLAPNRPARISVPVEPPTIAPLAASQVEPNLDVVGAPAAWDRGFTGQGIVVGIADTGVEWQHPALRGRYRGTEGAAVSHDYNWRDAIHNAAAGNRCGSNSPFPCDDAGHGTHVAGTVLGTDGAENQIGVAPGARWIGCRNMDGGDGTPARYTECFEFFLAPTTVAGSSPRPDLGADVISNSWGCPPSEGCTDPNILRTLFEQTRAAGIFLSVAAGNRGANGCSSIEWAPEFYEASFVVGATTLFDEIASFSGRGPVLVDGSNRIKPDVVAPGVSIRSSVPGDVYGRSSGTSMSTPHVSGAVAILWSAAPWLIGRVADTENILRATAVRLTPGQACGGVPDGAVPNPVSGWGRVDVAAAVAAALATGPSTPAPRLPVTRPRPGSRTIPPRN